MPTFTSPVDGAALSYRYYTSSSSSKSSLTLILLHGWPMSSRMFDPLLPALLSLSSPFSTLILPDRRGFGASSASWSTPSTPHPITFSTFVSDLSFLISHLNPGPFVFLAASMGCAESLLAYSSASNEAEYIRQHCKGFIWLGAPMPYPVRCEESPNGVDPAIWASLVAGLSSPGRKQFVREQIPGVFRTDLPGNELDEATLRFYEGLVAQADPVAVTETVRVICEGGKVDNELRALVSRRERGEGVPGVLVLHGAEDAGMPVEVSGGVIKEMVGWAELRVYEGAGHGLYQTHVEMVVRDVLEFMEGVVGAGTESEA
ncbi:Alpha/Beta hydrolase protein [Podospora aff. communis PSN243]|uniref:Alpha/Beta hydrolase protein n=1 Tax=Podospora aff. communis PSN243 TaxID=3040156 RepID=A0AAV9GWN1_9PEZI|nr:Alpha/Beta hydrolase protein [Podospora aff. communis PSN243]